MKKENIALDGDVKAQVLLGRDTRPSGMLLLEAAKQVWILLCDFFVVLIRFVFI